MPIKSEIIWRLGVVYLAVLLLGLIIIGKVLFLQIGQKERWSEANTSLKDITIESSRGDICAYDGKLLASSIPFFEIRFDPNSSALPDSVFYQWVDSLAACLAVTFDASSVANYRTKQQWSKYLKRAKEKGDRYVLIQKEVKYPVLKQLKTFPIFNRGKYKGGFVYNREYKRILPYGILARRTIGRLKNKGETRTTIGLEGAYDYYLRGQDGVQPMQRIMGDIWMPIDDEYIIEPHDGYDIITTLDINIQDVAENALLDQLKKHHAEHGCAIVMEVETGDIKAIANLGLINDSTYAEKYNYAIAESTEPGSTFKLASLMVALEDGKVDLYDTIETGLGLIRFNKFPIKDTKVGGWGKLTLLQVFELSSNVGVSSVIHKHYSKSPEKFIDRLYSMKLNTPLGIEIKGEGEPYIKYPADDLWSGISLPQMSIGYELQLTPLQILTFYNAVANNGKMVKPRFIHAYSEHGQVVRRFETEVLHSAICSQETILKVKKMLEGVVENGTATNIQTENYKIAGKTGTAQLADGKYGYKDANHKVSYQASFVGYFPADNPKYSCIVVINSPSSSLYYGNIIAGPVFKEIADRIYATSIKFHCEPDDDNNSYMTYMPYSKSGSRKELDKIFNELGIVTQYYGELNSDWVVTKKDNGFIEYQNRKLIKKLVPKVEGMGAKDAVYILEQAGMVVQIDGIGSVNKQIPFAGVKYERGDTIYLKLGAI